MNRGYFKRSEKTDLSENKKSEHKTDKAFLFIIAFFVVIFVFTLIKAVHDPLAAQQIKKLKISAFDILVFLTAATGYYIAKKRRKK